MGWFERPFFMQKFNWGCRGFNFWPPQRPNASVLQAFRPFSWGHENDARHPLKHPLNTHWRLAGSSSRRASFFAPRFDEKCRVSPEIAQKVAPKITDSTTYNAKKGRQNRQNLRIHHPLIPLLSRFWTGLKHDKTLCFNRLNQYSGWKGIKNTVFPAFSTLNRLPLRACCRHRQLSPPVTARSYPSTGLWSPVDPLFFPSTSW